MKKRDREVKSCQLTSEPLWMEVSQEFRAKLYEDGYRHIVGMFWPQEILGDILPNGDVQLKSGHLWSEIEHYFGPEPEVEKTPGVISLDSYRERRHKKSPASPAGHGRRYNGQ